MTVSTYTNPRQNSVREIERVSDADEDQLRVVEVGPLEEGVEHLLTLALQLIDLVQHQDDPLLGSDDLLLQKLLRFVEVSDQMMLGGRKDHFGDFGEDSGRVSERHAVDEGGGELAADRFWQSGDQVFEAGRLSGAGRSADVQALLDCFHQLRR